MFVAKAYYILTFIAVGITAVRAYILAAILPSGDFGNYAAVLALGAFCGILLGFGKVDETRKHFPQMWEKGNQNWVVNQSRQLDLTLVLRAACCAALVCVLFIINVNGWDFFALTLIFALSVSICSSGAAYLRSTNCLFHLGLANIGRAGTAFVLSITAAYFYSWQVAILAETAAALVFLTIVELQRRKVQISTEGKGDADQALKRQKEGRLIFYSALLNSIPLFIDRTFLKYTSDEATLGNYSFLMLIIVASSTFAGIQSQRIGPRLAALNTVQDQVGIRKSIRELRRSFLMYIAVICSFAFIYGVLFLLYPFAELGLKYSIELNLIVVALILGLAQFTVILEWYLISVGLEGRILFPAFVNMVLAVMALLLWPVLSMPLIWLIAGMAFAKLLQVCLLSHQIWTQTGSKKT